MTGRWNAARLLFALWYLFGWAVHVWIVSTNPQGYEPFLRTSLIPGFPDCWRRLIVPNIAVLAWLLIVFELAVRIPMLPRGQVVKLDVLASILFNLSLVQLGLTTVTTDRKKDFVANRLPNTLFALGQAPLLFHHWSRTLPDALRRRPSLVA